jgi:uncharacterized membrane protein
LHASLERYRRDLKMRTLETGGKAMGRGKSISIAMVGLVSGLVSMAPIMLAKDRDEHPRDKAADATFVAIEPADATSSFALDINTAGKIVGRYVSAVDGNTHGFVRNLVGLFTTINYPHAVFTVAAGINSHDDIVGQYRLASDPQMARHGFVLSRGTFTTIDFPGAVFTNALGVNRHGEIVGRYCTVMPCSSDKQHGFLLSRASFTAIDLREAAGTNAWGINGLGEIVGGYLGKDGKSHVYRLREGQFTTIDFPGAVDTALDAGKGGINSRGDIVSSYCVLEDPNTRKCVDEHAFLLSHGEFTTTMDFPGGQVTANFGINSRSDIVGTYNDANNTAHGFLLKLEDRDEDED